MKRKNATFWTVYAAFVLILVTVAIVGSGILVSWLDAFEKSQPIHSAQAIFDEYFVTEKWEEVLKLSNYEMSPFESKGEAEAALAALKEGKEMSYYSAGVADGTYKYNVVLVEPEDIADSDSEPSGGEVKDTTAEMGVKGIPSTKIATITVTKSKEAGSKWGFSGYEFTDLEIFLKKNENFEVRIPSHFSLYAGENVIDSEQIEEMTSHPWNEHLPEGIKGVEFATYRFEGLLSQPAFSVKDENGNDVPLVKNEENGALEAGIVYKTDVDKELSDRLLKGLEAYAAYMQDDGGIGTVSRYFDTRSDFYKSTASNPSSFVWDHQGYEFQNEVVENFYYFDENTLCCHIAFDQVLKMTGRENYVDQLSMTVFARKVSGTWRIFDCVNVGG